MERARPAKTYHARPRRIPAYFREHNVAEVVFCLFWGLRLFAHGEWTRSLRVDDGRGGRGTRVSGPGQSWTRQLPEQPAPFCHAGPCGVHPNQQTFHLVRPAHADARQSTAIPPITRPILVQTSLVSTTRSQPHCIDTRTALPQFGRTRQSVRPDTVVAFRRTFYERLFRHTPINRSQACLPSTRTIQIVASFA